MEADLRERMDRLAHVLEGSKSRTEDDVQYMVKWVEKIAKGSHRINKYRYRSRSKVTSRGDLAQILTRVTPYVKVIDTVGNKENLFNRERIHEGLRQVVEATRTSPICWDSQFVNPVAIVSRGLSVSFCEGSVVTLCCNSCKKTVSLDLCDMDLNEQYACRLKDVHSHQCVWSYMSVPLDMVYHLNANTVMYEITRIKQTLDKISSVEYYKSWKLQFVLPEKIQKIAQWFGFSPSDNLAVIYVLLCGYEPAGSPEEEILECVGSYIKTGLSQVLQDADYVGHPRWSCYYDKDRILDLMYETLIRGTEDSSISSRLSRLRDIVTKW